MSLAAKLRRIALERQGLLKANPFGRGKQAVLRAIEHLGYVQIDTISVVARAHHHVLWSRVDNYRDLHIDRLLRERKIFDYWYHAASWLPMRDYRFALPRMSQLNGERNWFADSDRNLLREVLRRITDEGPMRARDFVDEAHQANGWWEWKPAKQALEQLFMQGELMVSRREGFQKVYDLRERVLPDWVDTRRPSLEEYAAYLVDTTLRSHGFATLKSMTYLRRGKALREAVKQLLEARIDAGSLVGVDRGKHSRIYIDPERLESRAPRSYARVRLLSPFDNAVIQRQRGREIFDFDYQIECYLPESKRRYGYFCLPLLYRDRFVGRVDCKAHRDRRLLEIRDLHLERRVDDAFAESLRREIDSFAAFNGCDRIRCKAAVAQPYRRHLEAAPAIVLAGEAWDVCRGLEEPAAPGYENRGDTQRGEQQ
jgi:hypothetical protein